MNTKNAITYTLIFTFVVQVVCLLLVWNDLTCWGAWGRSILVIINGIGMFMWEENHHD